MHINFGTYVTIALPVTRNSLGDLESHRVSPCMMSEDFMHRMAQSPARNFASFYSLQYFIESIRSECAIFMGGWSRLPPFNSTV